MHTASETSSAASQVHSSNDVVDTTKAMAQGGFSVTRLHGNFVLPIILRTRGGGCAAKGQSHEISMQD